MRLKNIYIFRKTKRGDDTNNYDDLKRFTHKII